MWLSSPVTPKRTCPSVPATWWTAVASDRGAVAVRLRAAEQRGGTAVAEQCRAHDLGLPVPGRHAGEEAADALGGDNQRLAAGVAAQALSREAKQRDRARTADADEVVLVGGRVQAEPVDESVGQRRPAQRVVGGRQDQADLVLVEGELLGGLEREPEELLLGRLGARLEGGGERARAQLEVALANARAGEDRLREGVGGEPEQRQQLVLGERGRRGRDGQPAQPRERGLAALRGDWSEGGFRHRRNYRDGRAASQACESAASPRRSVPSRVA